MAITRNLSLGMTDPEVKELQIWLNAHGFRVASSGAGSPGNETSYFGPATQAAVQAFQAANGIVSSGTPDTTGYGRVGPQTLTAIQATMGGAPAPAPAGNRGISMNPISSMVSPVSLGGASSVGFDSSGKLVPTGGASGLSNVSSGSPVYTSGGSSSVSSPFANPSTPSTKLPSSLYTPPSSVSSTSSSNTSGGYRIPSGSNLSSAARAMGITLQQLLDANPQYKANPNMVQAGAILQYPISATTGGGSSAPIVPSVVPPVVPSVTLETVQANAQGILQSILTSLANGEITQAQAQELIAKMEPVVGQISQIGSPISPTIPQTDNPNNNANNVPVPPGVLPPSIENLTVTNLPNDAFNVLVKHLVPGTPEYQAAMDKLSTAYFDILQQQMNASTAQEQEAANYNWQTLKKTYETNLGVTLSNDAFQAWDQIQTLNNQYGQQNIQDSGLKNESIDSYLAKVRRADATARNDAQTKQEAAQQDYYMKFATPEQVKAFALANPEKAKAWGLVPSDEIRNAMSFATLKAKYPNMSDEQIQSWIASVLDENGNYRSDLYQRHMTGKNLTVDMGNINTSNVTYDQYGNPIAIPVNVGDTGVLDIQKAEELYLRLNTPLENEAANYAAGIALGTTPPTVGSNPAGGADTTTFNTITPPASTGTPPATNPPASIANPVPGPNAVNSTGNTWTQAAAAAAENMGTGTIVPPPVTGSTPPATGSTPPAAGTTTPKKKYGTLYEYYTAQGKPMPAWNSPERMSAATAAGITNYTGLGSQNQILLDYLQR